MAGDSAIGGKSTEFSRENPPIFPSIDPYAAMLPGASAHAIIYGPDGQPLPLHPGQQPQQQQQPPKNGQRPTQVQINPEVDVVEIAPTGASAGGSTSSSNELDDNDIVRKAKSMSTMAMAMFQFTRGEGELKTTQDLFTQAEFFADEANKMYKIVRHFTYQVSKG